MMMMMSVILINIGNTCNWSENLLWKFKNNDDEDDDDDDDDIQIGWKSLEKKSKNLYCLFNYNQCIELYEITGKVDESQFFSN